MVPHNPLPRPYLIDVIGALTAHLRKMVVGSANRKRNKQVSYAHYFFGSYIYLRKYSRSLSTELVRASTCRDS